MSKSNIDIGSISVRDGDGNLYELDYDFQLITDLGKIKGILGGNLVDGETYLVSYLYHPIVNSKAVNLEETNPILDGVKIRAKDVT